MPGLDPGIHPSSQQTFSKKMDHRVKPGDDELWFVIARGQRVRPFGRPDDRLRDEAIQSFFALQAELLRLRSQ
jgi:hypothetical protein